MVKPSKINIDGIILIDKPKDITSFDVIRQIKKDINPSKIGHAGTLDPLATGLLIVLLGKCTKLFDYFQNASKEYTGTIIFNKYYDSYDVYGNLLDEKNLIIKEDELINKIKLFDNKAYIQKVPKYSAVKINGKKAYDLARNNISFDLPEKLVNIYSFKKTSNLTNNCFDFFASVSKGTYIRSLAFDLGESLNTYGAIKELRRVKIDDIKVEDACNIKDYKIIELKNFLNKVQKIDIQLFDINKDYGFKIITYDKVNNLYTLYLKIDNKYKRIFSY